MLEIIAGSPFNPISELAAWKERCQGAEDQLARVEADRTAIISRLHELERLANMPETPVPRSPTSGRRAGPCGGGSANSSSGSGSA